MLAPHLVLLIWTSTFPCFGFRKSTCQQTELLLSLVEDAEYSWASNVPCNKAMN
jgi:hypothetical protein